MDISSFVRGSTIVDLIAIALVFLSSFVLIVTGIASLVWAKRKTWFIVLVVAAFLPVAIALVDATYRWARSEQALARVPELQAEAERFRSEFRTEFLITAGLGVAGTTLPLLIGGCGLIFKNKSEKAT